jgi:hypothetical protein
MPVISVVTPSGLIIRISILSPTYFWSDLVQLSMYHFENEYTPMQGEQNSPTPDPTLTMALLEGRLSILGRKDLVISIVVKTLTL